MFLPSAGPDTPRLYRWLAAIQRPWRHSLDQYGSVTCIASVVIIESAVFSRHIRRLMSDDELARFEALLVESPDSGDVIPEGGGLRKIRWTGKGRGKTWRNPDHLLLGRFRQPDSPPIGRLQERKGRSERSRTVGHQGHRRGE